MTEEEFAGWVRRRRFLYHVTARGSWPSISKHGLLTANALMKKCGGRNGERFLFSNCHRGRSETLCVEDPEGMRLTAVIRDQNALINNGEKLENEIKAQGCRIPLKRWYTRQNERVFFFPIWSDAVKLARIYAKMRQPQDILVVCMRSLVDAYRKKVELCAFNSGATSRKKDLRPTEQCGKWHHRLFQSIEDFPCTCCRDDKLKRRVVRELTVLGGVRHIDRHVVKVVSTDDGKECRVVIPTTPDQIRTAECALKSESECIRLGA